MLAVRHTDSTDHAGAAVDVLLPSLSAALGLGTQEELVHRFEDRALDVARLGDRENFRVVHWLANDLAQREPATTDRRRPGARAGAEREGSGLRWHG